jgi:hypothetical protein
MTSFMVASITFRQRERGEREREKEREREERGERERPPPLCCSKSLAEDIKSNKQCEPGSSI